MAFVGVMGQIDSAPIQLTGGEPMNQQQLTMKTSKALILSCLTAAAAMAISSCTTVVEPTPAATPKVTTTTTERNTLHHPSVGTTETKTTRTY